MKDTATLSMLPIPLAIYSEDGTHIYSNKLFEELVLGVYPSVPELNILINTEAFEYDVNKAFEDKSLLLVSLKEKVTPKSELKNTTIHCNNETVGILHSIGNVLTIIKGEATYQKSIEDIDISLRVLTKIHSKLESVIKEKKLADLDGIDEVFKQSIDLLKNSGVELQSKLDNIDRNTSKIADIIRSYQKYSSKDNKQHRIVSISDVVDDCVNLCDSMFKESAVEVKTIVPPLLEVSVDPSILVQIITNFIKNSSESIDERVALDPFYNNPEIIIEVVQEDGRVLLSVIDNGVGLSEENSEIEFGTSTKARGSGFGLNHCLELAKKMDGEVSLSSEGFNLGACATLVLSEK